MLRICFSAIAYRREKVKEVGSGTIIQHLCSNLMMSEKAAQGSFMQAKCLCVLILIRTKDDVGALKLVLTLQ